MTKPTVDQIQYALITLLAEFKLFNNSNDPWAQGVKDGIRKAMLVSGLTSPMTDRVEPAIQRGMSENSTPEDPPATS